MPWRILRSAHIETKGHHWGIKCQDKRSSCFQLKPWRSQSSRESWSIKSPFEGASSVWKNETWALLGSYFLIPSDWLQLKRRIMVETLKSVDLETTSKSPQAENEASGLSSITQVCERFIRHLCVVDCCWRFMAEWAHGSSTADEYVTASNNWRHIAPQGQHMLALQSDLKVIASSECAEGEWVWLHGPKMRNVHTN